MMVTGERSLPVAISTHEPVVVFDLPCPAEEGSDRAAWWAPGIQPGSTHHSNTDTGVERVCVFIVGSNHFMQTHGFFKALLPQSKFSRP